MNSKRKTVLVILLAVLVFALAVAASACTSDKATYTFNTDGGSTVDSVTLGMGEKSVLPVPQKDGYVFDGWYASADFVGDAVTEIEGNGTNATYYAKWSKLYSVTLQLDGGTLSATPQPLKENDDLFAAVAALQPQKSGYQFDAWYNGSAKIAEGAKMPAADVTLTAHYKVGYTVELWLQNAALDGYEKGETASGFGLVGEKVTPQNSVFGFEAAANDNAVTSITLADNPAQNVCKLYFDRKEFQVTVLADYPDGTTATKTFNVRYGADFSVPYGTFSFDGYCLYGWSESEEGAVKYKTGYLESNLYNADPDAVYADAIAPNGNLTLHAIWKKGAEDMFGGKDSVYYLGGDNVYLVRGGMYFKGDYIESRDEFVILDGNGDVLVRGRFINENTYVYKTDSRADFTAMLYKMGVGLNEKVKIVLDSYNGINFYETDEDGQNNLSEGTYIIEGNEYIATFTSGQHANETLTFITGEVTSDGVRTAAFQLRNDEEYNLGTLVQFVIYENNFTWYLPQYYGLKLDGYGRATQSMGESTVNYYYLLDDDGKTITLINSTGTSSEVYRIFDHEGTMGYMSYNEAFDLTYEAEDGSTLTLDGICNATYQSGRVKVSGFYTTKASAFGGSIITVDSESGTYVFLTSKQSNEIVTEVTDDDGNVTEQTETEEKDVFERKAGGYAEYYYSNADSTYLAPLIVVEDASGRKVSVYGCTTDRTFVKTSEGTVYEDSETHRMVYTATEIFDADVVDVAPLNLAKAQTFVFDYGTTSGEYNVSFWYFYKFDGGEEGSLDAVEYTDGDLKLLLIAQFVVVQSADGKLVGTYTLNDGLLTATFPAGTFYFRLNDETKEFSQLNSRPYIAYVMYADGNVSAGEYLSFDGMGGATYTLAAQTEEEEDTVYVGTVTLTEQKTITDGDIYLFTSEGKTFTFIQLYASSYVFFAPYNQQINGTYTAKDGSSLTVDGFSFEASYIDADGNLIDGRYSVSDGVIQMTIDGVVRYFDVDGKNFTLRGTEYGAYLVFDNQSAYGIVVSLDGYDKATVHHLTDDADSEGIVGSYSLVDGTITLTYTDGSETYTLTGQFGTFTYSSTVYKTIALQHEEIVRTFVNESDLSVLVLDAYGNATKYDKLGVADYGSYELITETLLYFSGTNSADALYTYDVEKGTVTFKDDLTAKGYFTEDLESLLFSKYGFVVVNNENLCYYNVVDGKVLIYQKSADDKAANKYGYVEEEFGEFDAVTEFDGKTYYANSGWSIVFKRDADGSENYPVRVDQDNKYPLEELVFTPGGSASFSVQGQVRINGETINCYVVREVEEDKDPQMYVVLSGTMGYFRLDIEAHYYGETNCSYKVVGMSYIISATSYRYMDTLYTIYMFFGSTYASMYTNSIGGLTAYSVYDESGEVESRYINGTFGESSGMYDTNGNIVQFQNATYTANSNGLYIAETQGDDGYTYRMYFILSQHRAFGSYGYRLYFFTREETLTTENGYTVSVERVVATEATFPAGTYVDVTLKYNDEELSASEIMLSGGAIYFICRETDEEGAITATTYYKIELTEKNYGEVEEIDGVIAIYLSATVEKLDDVTTLYAAEGDNYADVSTANGVLAIYVGSGLRMVTESAYDEATATYTVTAGGKTYTVKVSEGNVEIAEVEQAEEEQPAEEEEA